MASRLNMPVEASPTWSRSSNKMSLEEQFPGVEQSYLSELMRFYSNRVNLVISALLSEGHERSYSMIDEALFYKLKSHFPELDGELLRKILIKNNNHKYDSMKEICSKLGLFNTASYKHHMPDSPQLKLKYLVLNYDDIDANYLLDMLDNHENDIEKVIQQLNTFGYKRNEQIHKVTKISETVVRQAKAKLAAPRPTTIKRWSHKTVQEQEHVRSIMVREFSQHDIVIINIALEATSFHTELTRTLLASTTPHDSPKYFVRTLLDHHEPKQGERLVTRFVQTRSLFQDLLGVPGVKSAKRQTQTSERSTCTREDGMIVARRSHKLATGPDASNHHGPSCVRISERVERCEHVARNTEKVATQERQPWAPAKSVAQGSRLEFGSRIAQHCVPLKDQPLEECWDDVGT